MRKGDWFLTFTGKKFWPLDPHPDEVCIEDIAHALAHICRFNGHCTNFYSVAQHSLMVSFLVPKEKALIGLMHDATEAYVGDMIKPLKRSLPEFKRAELLVWKAIAQKFGFPETDPSDDPEIKFADNVSLMTERRDIITPSDHRWSLTEHCPPVETKIEPMNPSYAELAFKGRFNALTQ